VAVDRVFGALWPASKLAPGKTAIWPYDGGGIGPYLKIAGGLRGCLDLLSCLNLNIFIPFVSFGVI